ncbi:MAG: NACHT domain-containing protein [Pseudomonadales bacterium]
MYLLENLGDERFQQICQALLLKSYPDLQCLPVGQPDGGRDAATRIHTGDTVSQVVFQVKFVKDPRSKESREIIDSVVKSEIEKVSRLKERGMTRYYLLTNAIGSSHLDVGAVDRVNAALSDQLGVPAMCLWRDDIERRLDDNWDVKWSYPDILSAVHVLGSLIGNKSFDDKRRGDVISSYMAYQAKQDSQLKFKQVELQKTIADLFVDVPAKVCPLSGQTDHSHASEWALLYKESGLLPLAQDDEDANGTGKVGGLELLLNPAFAKHAPRVVVEGAPGQGKSTVTQYLCQVYRLMLLNRPAEYRKVDDRHKPVVARIPFRVDLRDYASWLGGKDPSGAQLPRTSAYESPVLESFIAAQVHRATGASFTVDDLMAVASVSQILIVLDGFDEVADISSRNRIVEEVSNAAERISQGALSSQIIVTSRPAAFANSPGFPRDEWRYVEILPLTRSVIKLYAEKWLSARDSDEYEKELALTVLEEKLGLVHVRDLARNPMQLAILLSLITVQGSSLPDKRTELYDSYIDIFLNRESEKSLVVRNHRGLIVLIHRYLAWHIHSVAEDQNGSGHLPEDELRSLIRGYLEANAHPTDLVSSLFTGMVERVVVLVSRIQGTFEFEVQPLREYFAARHLYDTAPQVPASKGIKGSKPERFDALARNFYWLNVTRFYAGCYSSGELSSLVDGIDELYEDPSYECLGYLADLSLTLINDHVLSLHPRLVLRILSRMLVGPSFPVLILERRHLYSPRHISVPLEAGRSLLLEYSVNKIEKAQKYDELSVASRIALGNEKLEQVLVYWKSRKEVFSNEKWINLGETLRVYDSVDIDFVRGIWDKYKKDLAHYVVGSRRVDILRNIPGSWVDCYGSAVRYGSYGVRYFANEATCGHSFLLDRLSVLYWPFVFEEGGMGGEGGSVQDVIAEYLDVMQGGGGDGRQFHFEEDDSPLNELVSVLNDFFDADWKFAITNSEPLSRVVECCRHIFGEGLGMYQLCVNYAAVCTLSEVSGVALLDRRTPLCERVVAASQVVDELTWASIVEDVDPSDVNAVALTLFVVMRFAGASVILSLSPKIGALLDALPSDDWRSIGYRIARNCRLGSSVASDVEGSWGLPEVMSPRLAAVLMRGCSGRLQNDIWYKYLRSYSGIDELVAGERCTKMLHRALVGEEEWEGVLSIIRDAYERLDYSHIYIPDSSDMKMPGDVAWRVCRNPDSYPHDLVALAAVTLKSITGAGALSLAKIAARDGWFDQDEL